MKKVLMIAAVAVFAVGCATASSNGQTTVSTHSRPSAVVAQPSIPSIPTNSGTVAMNPQSREQIDGMTGNPAVMVMDGAQSIKPTTAKGHTPQKGYAATQLNPNISAFGGVDNNPVEGAGLDISQVKNQAQRDGGKSSKRNPNAVDTRGKDQLTKASWIEGNNPSEDGSRVARNQVTGNSGSAAKSKASGKPNGKIVDKLSPMSKIANNNPADESSSSLDVPRDHSGAAQESFENRTGTLLNALDAQRVVTPPANVYHRDTSNNRMRDQLLNRRTRSCDNNPVDHY